ncbi:hypothetical protein QBC34DRAFT_79951 [Podospora aff. communis PSN243]|uniref:Ysc84 actin-binding domain-containing protein n=1 Tax=Podospora aff. communis PSN243 TaxID=3040156 RepID=A0AAV9GTR4_9PEZI|nr:hypothetical protein QBC34DRAFT_79951 [Podospora aff. communis PSN243]
MQRVSALLPSWDRSKANNNNTQPTTTTTTTAARRTTPLALDKVFGWAQTIAPASRISISSTTAPSHSNFAPLPRYGRETYWPTTLDRECDKAARILKSFCTDGFLALESQARPQSESVVTTTSVAESTYATKKIPPRIIQNAVGLAVFSCMRSGLWMSGSGGAGMITARKADGTWSPPSGIMLHTAALGFVIGVDIYDCVLVINNVQTLELFTRPRLTLGVDCSLTVGPLADKDSPDPEMRWRGLDDTVLTYVKARGKHQAVPLDGSLVTERGNENERFYCANVGVLDILAGNIPKSIPEMRPLFEVIKAAEGRSDYDKEIMALLAQQPAPGDAVLEPTPKTSPTSTPKTPFGIPHADDPDPFGVIGLEMAGIEIREAGTRMRPTSTQFEYNPSPTSPVFSRFNRQSVDTYMSRSNRGSYMSSKTQATAVTDACTQTDVASTADTTFSRANSDDGRDAVSEKLPTVMEPDEIDYTQIDMSMIERFTPQASPPEKEETEVAAPTPAPTLKEKPADMADRAVNTDNSDKEPSMYPTDERDEDADDEDEEEELEDEPVILEVATATQPARTSLRASQVTQVIHAKGAIVTIPKRIPPPLPARSPARTSRASKSDFGGDVAGLKSPLRSSFLSVESRAEDVQVASEEAADATPNEVFVTPPAVMESESLSLTPEFEKTEVQGHRKNTSSVCTAVVAPVKAVSDVPDVPAIPQTLEQAASSPEESEREPQTPKTESSFAPTEQKKPEIDGMKDVAIASHNAASNTIAVA